MKIYFMKFYAKVYSPSPFALSEVKIVLTYYSFYSMIDFKAQIIKSEYTQYKEKD